MREAGRHAAGERIDAGERVAHRDRVVDPERQREVVQRDDRLERRVARTPGRRRGSARPRSGRRARRARELAGVMPPDDVEPRGRRREDAAPLDAQPERVAPERCAARARRPSRSGARSRGRSRAGRRSPGVGEVLPDRAPTPTSRCPGRSARRAPMSLWKPLIAVPQRKPGGKGFGSVAGDRHGPESDEERDGAQEMHRHDGVVRSPTAQNQGQSPGRGFAAKNVQRRSDASVGQTCPCRPSQATTGALHAS